MDLQVRCCNERQSILAKVSQEETSFALLHNVNGSTYVTNNHITYVLSSLKGCNIVGNSLKVFTI